MTITPSSSVSARLLALETRQAELERRIADLEKAVTRQMPIPWTWPQSPMPVPLPSDDDGVGGGRCHVCGNAWKDMSHYVCVNDRCPNRVYCGDSPAHRPVFTCGGPSMAEGQPPSHTAPPTP